jgi:hypothetical protein
MARSNATNYVTPSTAYPMANAATDAFRKEDVQGLALAVDLHDHANTRGLPVARLAANAVDTAAIADGAVTSAKILDGTIASGDIASLAITSALLADGAVTTIKIGDAQVTTAKLAAAPMARLAEATGVATVYVFGGIPQTYRHLLIVCDGRSDTVAVTTTLRMRMQGISTNSYYDQQLSAAGTTPSASEALAQTSARVGLITAASAPGNLMGTTWILIPNYTSALKEKPFTAHNTVVAGLSTGLITVATFGGVLDTVASISTIDILPAVGSFTAESICTLYGLPQ